MKIAEVCLLTGDVVRLADFYRMLLRAEETGDDPVHQTVLQEETALTVYNDGSPRKGNGQTMCLAFTVEDVDAEYERLLGMGVPVVEKPVTRPWGARNMSLLDPDGNVVYLRSFPRQGT